MMHAHQQEMRPLIPQQSHRLLSLDFMRGLIMVLLMLEASHLYEHLLDSSGDGIFGKFILQFFHHPWNGLRFWDIIQPGFMFVAGTAMAYSLHRQQLKGVSWNQSFIKVLKRSWWLFFWGVLNYAVRPGGLSFELWNVLTQLSFTTLVAFLIHRWSFTWQIIFSLALLLLTEILYRFTNIPGFDQPFINLHNFGNYMDLVLMGKINGDGWVAINCIPTAAHTIWGLLAGKLLLSERLPGQKLKWLLISGVFAICVGYLIDFTVTPIIKRISTSSFVLASGGWCLAALAVFYWWIDLRSHRKYLTFFIVVGMNSLFIYLFFEIAGMRWFNGYVGAVTNGLMTMAGFPEVVMAIVTSLIIFALEWYLCWFLYKKEIFFKI